MSAWTEQQIVEIVKNGKKFRGLKMHGAIFDGMNLDKSDFRGCALPFASFQNCSLKYAVFEGANCSFVNFNGANVHRANFKDAILCDAKFDVKDAFGITITMDCRSFSHLKVNTGFWWGLLFYGFLMDPIKSNGFDPAEVKERLGVLFGPERYNTLKDLYTTRQM